MLKLHLKLKFGFAVSYSLDGAWYDVQGLKRLCSLLKPHKYDSLRHMHIITHSAMWFSSTIGKWSLFLVRVRGFGYSTKSNASVVWVPDLKPTPAWIAFSIVRYTASDTHAGWGLGTRLTICQRAGRSAMNFPVQNEGSNWLTLW